MEKRLESKKRSANSDPRDSAELYKETSNGSQSIQSDIGHEFTIPTKDGDLVMVDEIVKHEIDSSGVISSRCIDQGKVEEQVMMKIPKDTAQHSSFSPSEKRHDSSESSCTFIQSWVELESNKMEEIERKASFARNLVEENEELKRRMGMLCVENDELVTECSLLSERITYKAKDVLMLEDRIRDLQDYIELLEGNFGLSKDLDKLMTGHLRRTKCKKTTASSNESLLKWNSWMKSKDVRYRSMVEEVEEITQDDCNRGESVRSGERMEAIIEDEEEEEEEVSLLNKDATLSHTTLSDDTSTKEEILMAHETLASDQVSEYTVTQQEIISGGGNEELIVKGDETVKNNDFGKSDAFMMEDYVAMPIDNGKDVCNAKHDNIQVHRNSMRIRCSMQESEIEVAQGMGNVTTVKTDRGKGSTQRKGRKKDDTVQETGKKEKKEDISMASDSELNTHFMEMGETRDTGNQKEVEAIQANSGGNDDGKHGMMNDKRDNTPSGMESIKEEGRQNLPQDRLTLTKFIEEIWSIIGGSRQIEDVRVSSSKGHFDNDQIAKVSHAIWELKKEKSDLYLKQYELKELVGVLNAEAKQAQEELNEIERSREESKQEKVTLESLCRELKDKNQVLQDKDLYIFATCQSFPEEHRLVECLVKDLEQKFYQKEDVLLKMEGEFRGPEQEKSSLELRSAETLELERKINFWRGICGKLYFLLKKDNAKMAKVEERCEKVIKLAKKERSHRKTIERMNKKMLKKDNLRRQLLCSKARLSKEMGEKMIDLQLEIERLHSEIVNLKADRSGFEDSYKNELEFNSHLKSEVAGLESRVKLLEETLVRRQAELNNVLLKKKLISEELERVRNVNREDKRKAEELIEERRVIVMEVERQEREMAESKEKIKRKEMLLSMCKVELQKTMAILKIEGKKRHLLELSVKEEKEIRTAVE